VLFQRGQMFAYHQRTPFPPGSAGGFTPAVRPEHYSLRPLLSQPPGDRGSHPKWETPTKKCIRSRGPGSARKTATMPNEAAKAGHKAQSHYFARTETISFAFTSLPFSVK